MLGFVALEGHARLSESLENVHRGTAVAKTMGLGALL